MTPAQQQALEALVDRPLSADEIGLALARNDSALAASLSVGLTRIESCKIGSGTILAVMAPAGGLFLSSLRDIGAERPQTMDSANVEWTLGLINRGEFDIGMDASRQQLQLFAAANAAMAPGIAALLALAEVEKTISVFQVRSIFWEHG